MKKLSSILLLLCFAIYHFGYYAFYVSFDTHLESKWENKVYSLELGELDERMMEVPLTVPYMSYQEDFQVTNTRFEKDGKYYRAIKQRYIDDKLQIIYVPDTARKALDNTIKKWISSLVDDELPADQGSKTLLKNFVKDYIQSEDLSFLVFSAKHESNLIGFIFSAYQNPVFTLDSPPPQFS
ncbi:hypothetical protein [Algoriphagus sp.]|uniref:hypothetical protein n=1 Tax=Algoriphagus sp. TaxID=1872435 RepID=UPI0025F0A415|nr:hypothetical protein [Algoriphagus sp.]